MGGGRGLVRPRWPLTVISRLEDEKRCAHVKAAYEGGMCLGLSTEWCAALSHLTNRRERHHVEAARPGRVMRDESRAEAEGRWWCEESQYLPHEACSYGPIRGHEQQKNGVARAKAFQDCASKKAELERERLGWARRGGE